MTPKNKVINYICELAPKYNIKKVLLFGSRVRLDNGSRSDYDLAVYADNITSSDWAKFSEQIRESAPTLCRIDLVLVSDKIDKNFLKRIETEGVVVYEKK